MSWTLYTSPRSPFVRKVLIAAHELGLETRFTRQDVVTTPMTPAPELLPVNPLGMIPTLVVDGEVLFDSLTVLEFFDRNAEPPRLFPTGPARLECLSRHAMANNMTDKAVRILDERFRKQNDDTAVHIAGYVGALTRGLSWMEARLAPDRFDAGDIALAALLSYLDMRFPDIAWRGPAPEAADWYARVENRPSMTSTAFAKP